MTDEQMKDIVNSIIQAYREKNIELTEREKHIIVVTVSATSKCAEKVL